MRNLLYYPFNTWIDCFVNSSYLHLNRIHVRDLTIWEYTLNNFRCRVLLLKVNIIYVKIFHRSCAICRINIWRRFHAITKIFKDCLVLSLWYSLQISQSYLLEETRPLQQDGLWVYDRISQGLSSNDIFLFTVLLSLSQIHNFYLYFRMLKFHYLEKLILVY